MEFHIKQQGTMFQSIFPTILAGYNLFHSSLEDAMDYIREVSASRDIPTPVIEINLFKD